MIIVGDHRVRRIPRMIEITDLVFWRMFGPALQRFWRLAEEPRNEDAVLGISRCFFYWCPACETKMLEKIDHPRKHVTKVHFHPDASG